MIEEKSKDLNNQYLEITLNKKAFGLDYKNSSKKFGDSLWLTNLYFDKGIFDDPGNGSDNNGPDDLTDWLYLPLIILFLPANIVFSILYFLINKIIVLDIIVIISLIISKLFNKDFFTIVYNVYIFHFLLSSVF